MIFFQFVLWFLLAETILIALFFLMRKISVPFWVNLIIFPIELFCHNCFGLFYHDRIRPA